MLDDSEIARGILKLPLLVFEVLLTPDIVADQIDIVGQSVVDVSLVLLHVVQSKFVLLISKLLLLLVELCVLVVGALLLVLLMHNLLLSAALKVDFSR